MLQSEIDRYIRHFQEMFEKLSDVEFTQRIADSYAYASKKEPEISKCISEYSNAVEPSTVHPTNLILTERAKIGLRVNGIIASIPEVVLANILFWKKYEMREKERRIVEAKKELRSLGIDCGGE